MSDKKSTVEALVSKVNEERDELKLKLHLAGLDAKDEYERLSEKCDEVTKQLEPLGDAVGETAENVLTALGMVADELKIGFGRVRDAISEDE